MGNGANVYDIVYVGNLAEAPPPRRPHSRCRIRSPASARREAHRRRELQHHQRRAGELLGLHAYHRGAGGLPNQERGNPCHPDVAGFADGMGERVDCVGAVRQEEAAEHDDGGHQIEYNQSDFEWGQAEARFGLSAPA